MTREESTAVALSNHDVPDREVEHRINPYLSLRLKGNKTRIYVDGKPYLACKRLVITIPVDEISKYDAVDSIDQAVTLHRHLFDGAGKILEKGQTLGQGEPREAYEIDISPEEEFWGHASNLQAWYENGYDTRLLHYNLAFGLLKELAKAGDRAARNAYGHELASRLRSSRAVAAYLARSGHLTGFTPEDVERLELFDEYVVLPVNQFRDRLKEEVVPVVNGALDLSRKNLEEVPDGVLELKGLRKLDLSRNLLTSLPGGLFDLKGLEYMSLANNKIEDIPENLGNLKNVHHFSIGGNRVRNIPSSIGQMHKLVTASFTHNAISDIPEEVCDLENLRILWLSNNQVQTIPECIGNLRSLEIFTLSKNNLISLPDSIKKLDLVYFGYHGNENLSLSDLQKEWVGKIDGAKKDKRGKKRYEEIMVFKNAIGKNFYDG